MMPRVSVRVLALVAVTAGALSGCRGAAPVTAPAPAPSSADAPSAEPYEGTVVTAQLDRLERMAHEEWLSDGSVWVSDLAFFGVVHPAGFDTMLVARVEGHPRIGDRPILLGDLVTFVLPRNWRNRDLAIEDLEQLAFAE